MLTTPQVRASIASMDTQETQQQIQSRITILQEHLATIEQHLGKVVAENKRLREVVHLAESELRKRRDRVQLLEQELEALQPSSTDNPPDHENNHDTSQS